MKATIDGIQTEYTPCLPINVVKDDLIHLGKVQWRVLYSCTVVGWLENGVSIIKAQQNPGINITKGTNYMVIPEVLQPKTLCRCKICYEVEDICGFCGRPGADKMPHPIHWPGERSAGTNYVHSECEDEECKRAFLSLSDDERQRFLERFLESI